MDILGDFSSGGSSLPWLWIIEYLASLKEVDTSVLHDLIEMAPELSDDLAKSTREMVALRCLEDLFSPGDKVNDDDLSATDKKVGFALSESCEDVLQHILQETLASDLKMAGPELLKWDVHPFIMHKRASMPKCALQQLKDTILEGTHPLAASLKVSSGLMSVNECDRAGHLDHNAQAMSEKENLVPSTCEKMDGLSRDDFHNRNVLPSKRGRNDMADGELAGHANDVQEEPDLASSAKKLKPDAVSNDQLVDHCSDKEIAEYPSGRVVAVDGEGCIANQSQEEGIKESRFPEDGLDRCDDLRLGQNGVLNDDQIQHNQVVDGYNTAKMPQAEPVQNATMDKANFTEPVENATMDEANFTEPRTSAGAPSVGDQQNDTVDQSKGEMEHFHSEETSSENDENNNESIDVAKHHFLSSNCSLGYDTLATSSLTEQNLCVKCNKDGQLLVCSTSSCPLVVHENCLGCPVKFDESGNFHCPFCAYSLAISDFLAAKKKASVARKELAAFIGFKGHPKDHADGLDRKDSNHSRSNGYKDSHENEHMGGRVNNQEYQNGQHLRNVNNHVCEKVGSKEQSQPSASGANAISPSREETNVFSGRVFVSNGEKVMREKMVKECPSERGLDGDQDQAPPDSKSNSNKQTRTHIDYASEDHTDANGEVQEEDLQQASGDPSEKPVFALHIDGEETSEGENDKFIISNYQIRFRKRETHYTYPAIPQLRRKKVPWTAKEEEMIKKGVQKFASADGRNIPWKKILEYGSSVFLKGRTTIDLKDKWRNMCKGSPRSK